MPLKIWTSNGMKRLTRHKMTTFVGGVKKHIPKGVTFVNGEKVILWQVGEFAFNSWTLSQLQYPYGTSVSTLVLGLDATEDKVLFNVGSYLSRGDVSNISAPYGENTVNNGLITYRKDNAGANESAYDANLINVQQTIRQGNIGTTSYSATLNNNNITASYPSLTVSVNTINSTTTSGTGYWTSGAYIENAVNIGNSLYRILNKNGAYTIQKDVVASGGTVVATISANGYSANTTPTLYAFVVYGGQYIIFGAEYQATSGADYAYSIKKVDITDGTVSTLLDNLPTPVTSIMVDGNNLIVSADNKLYKMDTSGNVLDTYTTSNIMPTLVGKCGNYYYVTTSDTNYNMLVEIIDEADFTTGEVKQAGIKMCQTIALPYDSENGYLCFATKSYTISSSIGGGGVNISRTASIRQIGTGVAYTDVELRICRIQCY